LPPPADPIACSHASGRASLQRADAAATRGRHHSRLPRRSPCGVRCGEQPRVHQRHSRQRGRQRGRRGREGCPGSLPAASRLGARPHRAALLGEGGCIAESKDEAGHKSRSVPACGEKPETPAIVACRLGSDRDGVRATPATGRQACGVTGDRHRTVRAALCYLVIMCMLELLESWTLPTFPRAVQRAGLSDSRARAQSFSSARSVGVKPRIPVQKTAMPLALRFTAAVLSRTSGSAIGCNRVAYRVHLQIACDAGRRAARAPTPAPSGPHIRAAWMAWPERAKRRQHQQLRWAT